MAEIVTTIGVSVGCVVWIWLGVLVVQKAIKDEKKRSNNKRRKLT